MCGCAWDAAAAAGEMKGSFTIPFLSFSIPFLSFRSVPQHQCIKPDDGPLRWSLAQDNLQEDKKTKKKTNNTSKCSCKIGEDGEDDNESDSDMQICPIFLSRQRALFLQGSAGDNDDIESSSGSVGSESPLPCTLLTSFVFLFVFVVRCCWNMPPEGIPMVLYGSEVSVLG